MMWFLFVLLLSFSHKRRHRGDDRTNHILRANPDVIFENVQELLAEKQPQEAIGELTKFLDSEAAEFQKETAYRLRAHAYIQLGEYEKAREDEKQIEDAEVVSLIEKGEQLTRKLENSTDIEQTMDILMELFKVSPRSSYLFSRRAQIALENGQFRNWAVLSREAILLNPNNTEIYMSRARILFCNGFLDEALASLRMHSTSKEVRSKRQFLQKAIIGFRENLSKLNSKASKGNIDQSLQFLDDCNRSCSEYCKYSDSIMIDLGVAKARLLHSQNESAKAIALLTELIQIDGKQAELYAERGLLHAELHDYESAELDYERAVELDPDDMSSYEALRKVRHAKRRSEESLYTVLGLNSTSSDEQIREAYKNLTKRWHPDQFQDPEKKREAEERMKKINAAYEVLGNTTLREAYDNDIDLDNVTDIELDFPLFDIFGILLNPFPEAQELDPFSFF